MNHLIRLLALLIAASCGGAWAQLTEEQLKHQLESEITRTNPDFVVHIPEGPPLPPKKGAANEHFLVFDGPDGALMAVWTQSTHEGDPDQRIVFVRSDDEGHESYARGAKS